MAKSMDPATRAAMACTTGTDKDKESRDANGPSTPTKGVRTPAANQIVGFSAAITTQPPELSTLTSCIRLLRRFAKPMPVDTIGARQRLRALDALIPRGEADHIAG